MQNRADIDFTTLRIRLAPHRTELRGHGNFLLKLFVTSAPMYCCFNYRKTRSKHHKINVSTEAGSSGNCSAVTFRM